MIQSQVPIETTGSFVYSIAEEPLEVPARASSRCSKFVYRQKILDVRVH